LLESTDGRSGQDIKRKRARATHHLGSTEGTSEDTEGKRKAESGRVGEDYSPTRERRGTSEDKEKMQARCTHILESANGGIGKDPEGNRVSE
jgi:hypothetical protein